MTELLLFSVWCCVLLESSGALRHSGEGESEKQRLTEERKRVCVCEKSGTSASSPHPYCCLPAEWRVLHFLRAMQRTRKKRRLTSVKVTKQQTQSQSADNREPAADRDTERDTERETERDRWTDGETDELQHSAWCLCCPMFSTNIQLHTITAQKWEWIIFHTPKIAPTSFSFIARLFYDWTCLFAVLGLLPLTAARI